MLQYSYVYPTFTWEKCTKSVMLKKAASATKANNKIGRNPTRGTWLIKDFETESEGRVLLLEMCP